MSDYLWDRRGEPDTEVERLENLLGRLRDTRGAPELPLEAGEHVSSRAGLFSSAAFSRLARFAVAAALLLALLAGGLVMLRNSKTGGRASVNNESQGSNQRMPTPAQASAQEEAREEAHAPVLVSSPPKASASPEKTQQPQRREPSPRFAVASVQQQRRDIKPALARGEGFDGGAPKTPSDIERRVRAKEQLVYALRLTGEALREVRGRTKGVTASNAFDGQSPIR